MTYGWAILIISVVLASLFSLGVFNAGSSLSTACVSSAGYICSSPLLHAGQFSVTLGQATGNSWTNTVVYYDPSGTTGCAFVPTPGLASGTIANTAWNMLTLSSAASNSLTFVGSGTVLPSSATAGTSYSGTIWASYNSATASLSNLCVQVATVTLRSV